MFAAVVEEMLWWCWSFCLCWIYAVSYFRLVSLRLIGWFVENFTWSMEWFLRIVHKSNKHLLRHFDREGLNICGQSNCLFVRQFVSWDVWFFFYCSFVFYIFFVFVFVFFLFQEVLSRFLCKNLGPISGAAGVDYLGIDQVNVAAHVCRCCSKSKMIVYGVQLTCPKQ